MTTDQSQPLPVIEADELRRRVVAAAVLHGLVPTEPIHIGAAWREAIEAISQERLWGLAVAADDSGTYLWPSEARAALRDLHLRAAMFVMTAEIAAVDVARTLDDAGIEWRLLKGMATARVIYDRPELRDFGDLDVLVRPADFERAAASLISSGLQPLRYAPLGDSHRLLEKERTLIHPANVEVDLHRHVRAIHRGSDLSERVLFRDPTPLQIGGRSVNALSPQGLFLHACLHLASRETRASSLADVARFVFDPRFDLDLALTTASDERIIGYVDWAIEKVADIAPLPEHATRARTRHPVPRRLRASARYLQSHPSAALLSDFVAEPNRATLVKELVWPAPEFLRSIDRTRRQHVAYLATRPFELLRPRPNEVATARRLGAPAGALAPVSASGTRRPRTERRIRPIDLLQLPVAAVLLVVADLSVRTVSVPRAARLMRVRFLDDRPFDAPDPVFTDRERRWLKNARRIVRRWPFDATCLRRSLLVGWILRRHDPLLVIGVRMHEGEVQSHAWIRIGQIDLDDAAPQYVTF